MRHVNKIVLASTNLSKFEEFKQLLRAYPGIELVKADELLRNADKLAKAEIYATYAENAAAKARIANQGAHYPCLADDSGLEIEALGGKPGPKSARYAIPKAGTSQDRANMDKVLEELKGRPYDARGARFVAHVALVLEGLLLVGSGELKGKIAEAPMGGNGFGYDPIFIPEGHTQTLAQMTDDEKNQISHRARALEALMLEIKKHGIVFAKP
jgi:XTP/dITP diphosphohydrolase